MFAKMAEGLTAAAWGVGKFIVACGVVVGLFVYATTDTESFKAVVAAGMDAVASVLLRVFEWISAQAGGSGSSAA